MTIDPNKSLNGTEIPVAFQQYGEWGNRWFQGRLVVRHDSVFAELLDGSDAQKDDAREDQIILALDKVEANGPWAGREYRMGEEIHGQFGSGYSSPLSGKLYRGRIEIDGERLPPSSVYPGRPGYLQIKEEAEPITPEQRELLYRACYALQNPTQRFSGGASVSRLFPIAEIEARTGSKVYVA